MLKVRGQSHTDHGLTADQFAFVVERFGHKEGFFAATVELPEGLGTVPCGLHGPLVGDEPVKEEEVYYAKRAGRDWASRLCARPPRETRTLSVIGGPLGGEPCVLYTAFGGPLAPREPFDTSLDSVEERWESLRVWNEHALSGL